jgi:arsenate reductase (thioredoxin)
MNEKQRVLILCTGNSARSQMAEGLLRDIAGDRFEVESAGVAPSVVRPEAVQVMSEIGIDISTHRSKSVDEFSGAHFAYVITVCDNANESCPVFPGKTTRIHWSFDDPAAVEGSENLRLEVFRRVRDEIRVRLGGFVDLDADPDAEARTESGRPQGYSRSGPKCRSPHVVRAPFGIF